MYAHQTHAQVTPSIDSSYSLVGNSTSSSKISQDLNDPDTTFLIGANNTSVNMPQVKITSHQNAQQVPVGILEISGHSADNQNTACNVYVILNNIKPYQKVVSATDDQYDLSSWSFTFLPSYSLIKEGNNKMTAKITCARENGGTNITKFNSLNVTGVSPNTGSALSDLVFDNDNNANPITPASFTKQSEDGSPERIRSTTFGPSNNAITPAPYTSEDMNQYSSTMLENQEEIKLKEKNIDGDTSEQQGSGSSAEVSKKMEKIVDDFTEDVGEMIERQVDEIFTSGIPFELALPLDTGINDR